MADAQKRTPAKSTASADKDPALANEANPTGQRDVSTGDVGTSEAIDAQEHVLGDDSRRVKAQTEGGYHDSLTGRPIDGSGNFTDLTIPGSEGPVPQHRIVANDPQDRVKIDDKAERPGNEAS